MKITVEGMHCEACKILVKMELEENGFEDKIESVEVTGENVGEVVLKNIDEKKLSKAKSIINATGDYSVED